MNSSNISMLISPLFKKDDCKNAYPLEHKGGRAMQERLPRSWGKFFK
jgi:hypothetical protein